MKISQQRQLDRFKRSLDFLGKHSQDFAPDSKATKAQEQLKNVIARAESNTSEDGENKSGRRVYHSDKLKALNALRAELVRVSNTASLIEAQDESFNNTFKMPDKRRKNELAKAAHHFIEEVPKVSDKFADFELKAADIDQLKSALENYEQVQSAPISKPTRQQRTAAAPNPTIAEGTELLRTLDIIMHNKFRDDPKTMDAWNNASALEVTRRRRKNKAADAA